MNYIADFQARTDLTERYGNNALLLYALQLRFEITDIISVASDALTDGGDDKKCDLIYIDPDTGVAVMRLEMKRLKSGIMRPVNESR